MSPERMGGVRGPVVPEKIVGSLSEVKLQIAEFARALLGQRLGNEEQRIKNFLLLLSFEDELRKWSDLQTDLSQKRTRAVYEVLKYFDGLTNLVIKSIED